jgi:tetratricopeptide (TPR) repeat protein
MRSKHFIIATSMLIGASLFAQKKELKEVEKLLKKEAFTEADGAIIQVEAVLLNATEQEKAQYYFLKGSLALAKVKKNLQVTDNLLHASKSFLELIDFEKTVAKPKFTKLAEEPIADLRRELLNHAVADNEKKDYNNAAAKLYQSYLLKPADTTHLYFAASSAVTAQNYDSALDYYKKLAHLGYTGKSTSYTAINKVTNQVENFGASPTVRDMAVKQGTHTNPQTVKEESKRGEIVKNIALIYTIKGDTENAKKAILDARKENPNDISLIMTEANMYLESKEMDKYESLIKQALEKDPNNSDLYYNLGVVSANSENFEAARKYYLKAIELDPKMENAYINLSSVLLNDEKAIVDKMNSLGNTAADNKKYDELKKKREDVFKSAVPYLEKVLEINPANQEAGITLANIYTVLGELKKAKELRDKYKQ